MLKVSRTKFHQNWTTKSRIIHVGFSIPRQYQMMMPSVAWVKFIKTKVIFRNHTKGVWNQVSSKSDHEIKSYVQIPGSKWEKTKKWEKIFWVTQIGADFKDYRSRQEGVQIEAALDISNQDKKITNRGWDFKLGKGLQIGAEHT